MSGNEEAREKPFGRPLGLDFAGVPIKKRRFLRPPSPPPEEEASELVPKDASQKGHSSLFEKSADSSAGKASSALLASGETASFVSKVMEDKCSDPAGPSGNSSSLSERSGDSSAEKAASVLLTSDATRSFVPKVMEGKCVDPAGQTGYGSLSEKSVDSSSGKAASPLLASDATGSFVPKVMASKCAEPARPSGYSSLSEKSGDSSAGKVASGLCASDASGSFVPQEMEGRCADPAGPSGYSSLSEKSGDSSAEKVTSSLFASDATGSFVLSGYSTVKVEPSAVGSCALSALDNEAKDLVSGKHLGVASSTLLTSEATCSFVLKEMKETCAGPDRPSGLNTVKVEPSSAGHVVLSPVSDKESKLLVSEKSVGFAPSTVNDGLDSRLCEFVNGRSDKQRYIGGTLIMSKTQGNPELSLGLEGRCISSRGDDKLYKNGEVCGSIKNVSLNLSLTNKETFDGGPDIAAKRSNWDLNTTMDAWEDSETDAASHLKPISESEDVKTPMCSTVTRETCFNNLSNQQLCDSDCRSLTGNTISQSVEKPIPETSLNLRLSPSISSSNISHGPSISSINKLLHGSVSNISLSSFLAYNNANKVGSGNVKPEPVDEGLKLDSGGASSSALQSLESAAVMADSIGKPGPDILRSLHCSPGGNSIAPGTVKPEMFNDSSLRMSETTETSSIQCDKSVLNSRYHSANDLKSPVISDLKDCQSRDKEVLECREVTDKCPCSPMHSEIRNMSEELRYDCESVSCHSMELAKLTSQGEDMTSSLKNSPCGGQADHEFVVQGMTDIATVEKKHTNFVNESKVNSADKLTSADHQVQPVGDEEKNCSSHRLVEEERSEPEYESDGNSVSMDIEEDGQGFVGIEDGVLPEPGKDVRVGGISEVQENDRVNGACHDAGTSVADQHICTELRPDTMENPSDAPATVYADVFESTPLEEEETVSRGDVSSDKLFAVQMPGADEGASFMISPQQLPIMSGEGHGGMGTDQLSNQAHSGGQESSVTVVQDPDEHAKSNDVDQNFLQLPNREESLVDESAKDPSTGVHRCRIINLSRASTETTPSKTKPMDSCTLQSCSTRERLPNGPLERDRPQPRERNDFWYNEGFRRFPTERYQERRNYRMNYTRGRGRLSDRNNSPRAARTSEFNFVPELSDCLSEYGVPKNKYVAAAAAAAVAAAGADTKYGNHNVVDDGYVGAGRGRRKVEGVEAANFRQLSSQRRSPGGRNTPRGTQIAQRVPRNINEGGDEGVGLRRSVKFTRESPADSGQHPYSRNQRPYKGVNCHFDQRARNILPVQRRAPLRFHSKSPIRSQSPGPWPSSKKRSPDAFDGQSDFPHRRSPPVYRMDRVRSPEHAGFPVEVVTRRHGSPTFSSRANELRELNSSREHAHSRSMVSRSPASHVALRNYRRFGAGNPRDRTDGDEFVTGLMHSGRFHDVSDGDIENRRKFNERRGHVCSFRATFNGPDEDNYPISTENGPLRFFRSDDQQFQERADQRERPFERRMKNRSVNAPRRPSGAEDKEGNYSEQGIYDDDQDDVSRMKRQRF